MSDATEQVNKTKLLLTLKTEVTDVKQALDNEKAQIDKLQKKLAQVGPALDAMKEGFNGELARLRDEVADESQILMKVVSWIRDKLDSKIDGKIENAKEQWMGEANTVVSDGDAKTRKELTELLEEERSKWEAKWEQNEVARKTEVELLKEEFARNLAEAKDKWQQERIELETQIQTLHKEQAQHVQTRFSSFEAETKLLVATEVDKAATEKTLQTEEKLHRVQGEQSEKLRAEFQKSGEDFRELLKMDLALLRNDERLLWEKERQAIREEERKFRESVRATIVEEISRFQADALNVISAAQEELAKRKAKGFVDEAANGEMPKEDELFAIGKELSEKQFKREKEIQTNKMKIQPDNILKRFGDEEDSFEQQQQNRDVEHRKFSDSREKEEAERRKEEQELKAREEDIRKERERLENMRKQLESDQKREKQEAAQRQREEDLRKEKERAEQLQKLEEEREEKLQQLRKQKEEDSRKEKERQEESRRTREEEERKLEELKRQNALDREEREKERLRAQERREREEKEREHEAELKKEEEKRKKRERKEAEERERLEKEREREEKELEAKRDREEQERLKKEKKEKKFRERQEQEEREKLERDQEAQRLHEEEERENAQREAREEEESRRLEEEREEKDRQKKLAREKKEREREEKDARAKEEKEKQRQKDEAEKERKRREREEEEERLDNERKEKERKQKEKDEKDRKQKEKEEKERKQKEKEKKEQESKKSVKFSDDDDDEDEKQDQRQLLTNPSKPKRAARPPTQITPQIATRDTTDDADSEEDTPAPPKPQKAGSVSVLPPAPTKIALKSTAQSKPAEAAKKDSPRESANGECDVSDPEVQNAWKEVRSDTSSTNWFLLGYGGSKTVLQLYGSGSGGVAEFQKNLKNEILYGYIRVSYGDNSQAKFIFVTYFPENISQIQRARANPHKIIVDRFVKNYNIIIAATTPDEVGEDVIMPKLRAAGGASYGANQATQAAKPTTSAKESDKNNKKEDDKAKEVAEKQKKEDERRAKEDAERKKQEEEKRKEEEKKKEQRKLKDKEDSFSAFVAAKETTTPGAGAIGAKNSCSVCAKTVYLTEQIVADNKTYHKTCFRCAHCNNIIKLGNYAALNGKLYCKPHFKQLFASKGNYNEGFGKQKLTHEWAAKHGGGDDDEDDEEEAPAPAPAPAPTTAPKSAPAPAATKAQPVAAASTASSSPQQKKSDISGLYSSLVKDKPKAAPTSSVKADAKVLKSTLFDSDDEEDALFAK